VTGPEPGQTRGWADRVAFTSGPDPVAYRPGQVIVPASAAERIGEVLSELFPGVGVEPRRLSGGYLLYSPVPDPVLLVQELRDDGIRAQLNHVFFAHCGECCGPHPSAAGSCGPTGSPVYATPVYATSAYANPVYATPVYATPVYATGSERATGRRSSSAVPVAADDPDAVAAAGRLSGVPPQLPAGTKVDAFVLDTSDAIDQYRPMAALGKLDADSEQFDQPDGDGDVELDPCAGHTSFIVGLIKSIAPAARVVTRRVLHPEGDGDEATIGQVINGLHDVRSRGAVLNLSFGGYALDDDAGYFASAVRRAQARGWVVVASAGNDATCRRTWPAAFPDVVSVGAVGPHGPAPFTNYGPWVRASAPGVDLVSTFFSGWDDKAKGEFDGWARWSGTSFSAPLVTGAIVAYMHGRNATAQDAVARIVDGPGLLKIHNLGTPVNVV
jgi:Subtilase family